MSRSRKLKSGLTILEISQQTGISRWTVSAVINGKRKVRESTRAKVLDCIRQERYRGEATSPAIEHEFSHMVAILIPELDYPFHEQVLRGVHDTFVTNQYNILLWRVGQHEQERRHVLERIARYRPAGYIVVDGAEGSAGECLRAIQEKGIRSVFIGETALDGQSSVSVNERRAMKGATDRVIELGHHRLAYLAGPEHSIAGKERKLGFFESVVYHHLEPDTLIEKNAGETAEAGYHAALSLLKDARCPTAILCHNDLVALGVYRAAHETGRRIPHDLSVVGFDGLDFCSMLAPPLTTVDVSPRQQGTCAAQLLLSLMHAETPPETKRECLPVTFVEGSSLKSPS